MCTEALQRFGVDPKTAVQNMREKYLTGTKQGKNGLVPGVCGARVYTTQHIPAKITPQLFEAKDGETLTAAKWKRLIIQNYYHAAVFLKVSDFKITRNGISLDMTVDMTFERYLSLIHI